MTFAPVQVSATDGPMPDTVEQFKAIRAQGGTTVDVVITHTDLVDDEELLELVELEVRELATQNGLSVDAMTRSQGA
jgi:elongation factor Tu